MDEKGMVCYLKNDEEVRITPETRIFKYMPLDHFLGMLNAKALYVSRKKSFPDRYETKLPIRKLFSFYPVGGECPYELNEKTKASDFKRKEKLFKRYEKTANSLTSCWTLFDKEDFFMWEIYAKRIGVCIQTTIDKLIGALINSEYDIYCGAISYKRKHCNEDLIDVVFSKDPFYANEKEFRFYFHVKEEKRHKDKEEKGRYIPLNSALNNIIEKVILSPYIVSNGKEELMDILHNKYKIPLEHILKSDILFEN